MDDSGETKEVQRGLSGVSMSSRSKRVLQVSLRGPTPVHLLTLSPSFPFSLSVFYNVSRSPHLITLLAFSRMKELQRPRAETRVSTT